MFYFITAVAVISVVLNVFMMVQRNKRKTPDGLLNVDTRDPNKDFYDFVFLIPTTEIPKREYLTIEVKTKS